MWNRHLRCGYNLLRFAQFRCVDTLVTNYTVQNRNCYPTGKHFASYFALVDIHSRLLRLLWSLAHRSALRRLFLASLIDPFSPVVDGRCFRNGFDMSRKSSSDCVTDRSDKNDPVELMSLLGSANRVDRRLMRAVASKKASFPRVSSLMLRSHRKKSPNCDNFFSCQMQRQFSLTNNARILRKADGNNSYVCIALSFGGASCFAFVFQQASGMEQFRLQFGSLLHALVQLALYALRLGHRCLPLLVAPFLDLQKALVF